MRITSINSMYEINQNKIFLDMKKLLNLHLSSLVRNPKTHLKTVTVTQ